MNDNLVIMIQHTYSHLHSSKSLRNFFTHNMSFEIFVAKQYYVLVVYVI